MQVVIFENAIRVLHDKTGDELNNGDYYMNYKKIVKAISTIIIDNDFKYPISLAANIVEQSLNNEYYLAHLPNLTVNVDSSEDSKDEIIEMLNYVVDRLL